MLTPATTFGQIFGRTIARRRTGLGLGQGDVAVRLGISASAYSRLETGQAAFSLPQMRLTAQVLRVPLEVLLHEAEASAREFTRQGVKVLEQRPNDDHTWLWVALGAVASVVALTASAERNEKKEGPSRSGRRPRT